MSRTGRLPQATQALEIATVVGEDRDRLLTWAIVCEIWEGTHDPGSAKTYNLANHRDMLAHFERLLREGRGKALERTATTYEERRTAMADRLAEFK